MRKVLLVTAVLLGCTAAGAVARRGPECQPNGLWRACNLIISCFSNFTYGGDLRIAAQRGDGNGVSGDTNACLGPHSGWDDLTAGCDSGNMRLAGFAAWEAFTAYQPSCAPINQWHSLRLRRPRR
jgi:hypothetical protein